MATAPFVDDLLTCTICLETFKVPKYLPCLHTFCETCINTYILSTVKDEAESKTGFKCPVCRRLVKIGKASDGPETWAKMLPGNFLLMTMIDKQAISKSEKNCTACEITGKTEMAVSWCTVCFEAYCKTCEVCHTAFKISSTHKVVPIKEALTEQQGTPGYCEIVTCHEHPDKLIEIYCKDHSKPCCTICATVQHRKCDEVVTIDKATSGVKKSEKVKELSEKLNETNKTLDEILRSRKKVLETFEDQVEVVFTEIGKMRENINKHLDRIEQTLQDEMQRRKKEVVIKLNDETSHLSSLNSMVENWKRLFETCLAHASDLQCLIKLEEILGKMSEIEREISEVVNEMKDVSVKFHPNEEILNIESFGSITFDNPESSVYWENPRKKFNFHTGQFNVVLTIDVKRGVGYMSGMFSLKDILLTDYSNSKIMKYDSQGNIKQELTIPLPSDITNIDNHKAAVATNSTKVYIINIDNFIIDRELTLGAHTWGLRFVGDHIIAASQNGTISWLDATTGAKIKDIRTSIATYYVCCPKKNKKTDYMYMDTRNSIKYVSGEGAGFTYKDSSQLVNPYSQDTDCKGNVYTIGYGKNNIHQLTSDGKLVRVISVTDIDKTCTRPWVLRFEENSNRFLLIFYSLSKVLICEIG